MQALFESHGVIGLGEVQGLVAGAQHIGGHILAAQPHHAGHEVLHGETVGQVKGGTLGRFVIHPHLVQFAAEERAVVLRGRFGARRVDEARDRIEPHGAVGLGHAGSEGDGRDVSFARGAQAEDEAQFVRGES